jgi:hypothetical protein
MTASMVGLGALLAASAALFAGAALGRRRLPDLPRYQAVARTSQRRRRRAGAAGQAAAHVLACLRGDRAQPQGNHFLRRLRAAVPGGLQPFWPQVLVLEATFVTLADRQFHAVFAAGVRGTAEAASAARAARREPHRRLDPGRRWMFAAVWRAIRPLISRPRRAAAAPRTAACRSPPRRSGSPPPQARQSGQPVAMPACELAQPGAFRAHHQHPGPVRSISCACCGPSASAPTIHNPAPLSSRACAPGSSPCHRRGLGGARRHLARGCVQRRRPIARHDHASTPQASAVRRQAPRLCGSCTPSSASSSGWAAW